MRRLISRSLAIVLASSTVLVAVPAVAQEDADSRIRRLEAEIRALQRVVFPGGDGRYFTPEVQGQQPTAQPTIGAPASGALTDVLARLDTLERAVAQLTARLEEGGNDIREIDARLAAIEERQNALAASTVTALSGSAPGTGSPATGNPRAGTPAATLPAAPVTAAPSAERLAAVQAIAKPDTGDAGDDEYSYGFRLWDAGFFPEAQQQLQMFVQRYPDHWRTTYGRNLLGRAYLDARQPREAVPWFLQNYQSDPSGVRAGDSLLYLAEAMIALEDTSRACIALAEFGETYPALASGRLQSQYDANRARVTCTG